MAAGRSRRAEGSFKVSDEYFVRLPCASAAQLELHMRSPVPFSPRGGSERMRGRVRPSSASPLKAVFFRFLWKWNSPNIDSKNGKCASKSPACNETADSRIPSKNLQSRGSLEKDLRNWKRLVYQAKRGS